MICMTPVVVKVTGLAEEALLSNRFNSYIGVSIGSRFFSKERMRVYFQLMSERFENSLVVLMDDPDRYNFELFKSLTPEQSLQKARIISDEIRGGYEKLIRLLGIENVSVVQFRDFSSKDGFKQIVATIRQGVEKDSEFRKSLLGMVEDSIGNKISDFLKANKSKERERVWGMLINYTIEELSALIYFTENGYPIEIDPHGEFHTKKKLYEGFFPEIERSLAITKRGHLDISLTDQDYFKINRS